MPKRRLDCACCGGDAGRWEQHLNQDTGYGICADCIVWIQDRKRSKPMTAGEIKFCYGTAGVNYEAPSRQ